MVASVEALLYRNAGQFYFTAEDDLASGEILQSGDGRAIVVAGLKPDALVEGQKVAAESWGIFHVRKAASVTFVVGDRVYWDDTANEADVSGDFCLGVAVRAAASADETVLVDFNVQGGDVGLLELALAASTAVTNTVTETAFDNASHIFPAASLRAGDIIRVKAQAIATATHSTDTLTLKLKIGSTVVVATAAVDVADNDIGFITADIVVRTIGASGTFVASGVQGLGVPGTATAKPWLKASTAIDTTAAQTLAVTGTWSVADPGNSCRLDNFSLELIRK